MGTASGSAVARSLVLHSFPRPCPPHPSSNAVIDAAATEIDYPERPGLLSIKAVFRGVEVHELQGVRYPVDERAYLVLNDGQRYSSCIRSRDPVEVFTVFFERGLAAEVVGALATPLARLLDGPLRPEAESVHFFERLYPRPDAVGTRLSRLRQGIRSGHGSDTWIEEQLRLLIEDLIRVQQGFAPEIDRLPAARESTRTEAYQRLLRARDFIDSSLAEPIDLGRMARVACLSRHHFLRLFTRAFGETPHQYLTRQRLERARELLLRTGTPVRGVCLAVGFEGLGSFSLLFRRRFGVSPSQFRRAAATATRPGSAT